MINKFQQLKNSLDELKQQYLKYINGLIVFNDRDATKRDKETVVGRWLNAHCLWSYTVTTLHTVESALFVRDQSSCISWFILTYDLMSQRTY